MEKVKKYRRFSMLTYPRLIHLKQEVEKFRDREDVCYVECGVAKGGALALIRDNANKGSMIYGFDSFDHMPSLSEKDENEQRALIYNFIENGLDKLVKSCQNIVVMSRQVQTEWRQSYESNESKKSWQEKQKRDRFRSSYSTRYC